jgi:hypothetical protein
MSRHVEMDNASTIMHENDKDEQNFKPNRVYGEEVDRSELRYVIVEECSPCLRWWFRASHHVFGNGGLGNLNA